MEETTVSLPVPVPDPNLFKREAAAELLSFLVNNRDEEFTISNAASYLNHSQRSVGRASDILAKNNLIEERREGKKRYIRINRSRLSVPDDPYFQIPQQQFYKPVKAAVDHLVDELDDVLAVILFGSVARGEADRASDIDLWVLVREDRASNQRVANNLKLDLEEERFDNERYEFEIDVEQVATVPQYTEDINHIISSGIVLHSSDDFTTIRNLIQES